MEDSRIYHLLGHHRDGKPFSFKMDLWKKRCTEEEISELLEYGYIEYVKTDDPYDIRYRVSQKGKVFLK